MSQRIDWVSLTTAMVTHFTALAGRLEGDDHGGETGSAACSGDSLTAHIYR